MCTFLIECPDRTECLRGVCRCKKSETIVNGICRKAIYEVPPGGRCDTQKGLDCIGESHCFYGICVCLYGLVNLGYECASANILNTVKLGNSCQNGQQCEGGSICLKGMCQCKNGEIIDINKRCAIKTYPEQFTYPENKDGFYNEFGEGKTLPFSMNEKASKFIYGMKGLPEESKFSQILTANQMSINVVDQETLKALISGQLMPLPKIGEKCDGMCSKSAKCVRSVCQCTDGLVESKDGCIYSNENLENQEKSINNNRQTQFTIPNYNNGLPGNGCAPNSQCFRGSICINGLCVCRPGYKPLDNICQIAKVQLGESCFINEQCKDNGFCIGGICSCRNEYENQMNPTSSYGCSSRPIAHAGEDCSSLQACGWNSVCGAFSQVCECPLEMETYQGACVVARKPRGSLCYNSINCHKSSYCDNGYCICKAGYTNINNYCLPPPRLVNEDPRSYIDPNIIIKNTASSANSFYSNNLHSEPDNPHFAFHTKFGKHITQNSFPTTNSIIEPSKVELLNFNRLISGLTQPQINTQQQQLWNPNELFSQNQLQQQFLTNNFRNKMTNQFFPQSTVPVYAQGSSTLKLDKNQPLNKKTKVVSTNEENTVAMPGEYCNLNRICLGNSRCISGWCQCVDGMKIEKEICAYQSGINLSPFNAAYKPTKATNEQVYRLPYESCENSKRCISGAVCIKSDMLEVRILGPFCMCRPGKIFFMNTCINRHEGMRFAKIGEKCNSEQICENGATCTKNETCDCKEEKKLIMGLCVTQVYPGESCRNGEFCTENAVCATGLETCVCPIGMQVRFGRCEKESKNENITKKIPSLNSFKKIPSSLTALPGQSCDAHTKCSEEAICSPEGYCTCRFGYIEVYNMCILYKKVRVPGEKCLFEEVCSKNSWCKEGLCQCINLKEPINGECELITKKKEGSIIRRHQTNRPFRAPTKMVLEKNALLQEYFKIFKRKKEFSCNLDSNCPIGSECINSICSCNEQVIEAIPYKNDYSKENTSVIRCETDEECPSILNCLEKTCVCIRITQDYYSNNKENTEEEYSYSQAIETIKENNLNYSIPSASAIILPGMFCDEINRCGKGAQCNLGMCRCINTKQHLTFVNGTTSCENLDQFDYENWNLIPESFQITTKKLYKDLSKTTNNTTLKVLEGDFGMSCEYSYQCKQEFVCFNKVCTCLKANNSSCLVKVINRRQIFTSSIISGNFVKF